MSLVTIIVPAFNAESTIEKCLKSLNEQYTSFSYTVLVVNDGSTDSTENIVQNFNKEHTNFHLINIKNEGVGTARNVGLDFIHTKYVGFVDADDYVEPTYLNVLLSGIQSSDLSVIGFQEENVRGNILLTSHYRLSKLINQNETYNLLLYKIGEGCGGFLWNKMYKTSIILDNNIKFSGNLMEDFKFNIDYLTHCKNTWVSQSILYHYVDHESSIVGSTKIEKGFHKENLYPIYVLQKIERNIAPKFFDKTNKELLCSNICHFALASYISMYSPKNQSINTKQKQKIKAILLQYGKTFLKCKYTPLKEKFVYVFILVTPTLFSILWNIKHKNTI